MTIKTRFPSIEPSLDLNFAATKRLDPRITFTRASSATFVNEDGLIEAAGVNQARFDHAPTTGESLGLLVEEQRTNLLVRSEEFNTTWVTTSSTVTPNSTAAPNGTVTADTITWGAFATSEVYQFVTLTAATHTLSVYARSSTGTKKFRLKYYNGTTDLFSAEFTATTDWQRFSYIVTGVAVAGNVSIRNSSPAEAGDLVVWGAQLEAGTFPTSYIPTTTAAATRSADVASITGTNFSSWYNQTEGTVYVEFGPYGNGGGSKNPGIFQIDSGSAVNTIRMFCGGSISPVLDVTTSSVNQAYISAGILTPSATSKISGSYKINDFARAFNGSNLATDSGGTVPTLSQMLIGTGSAGVSELNGHIRRLTYFPQRLPNSTLQQLTQ